MLRNSRLAGVAATVLLITAACSGDNDTGDSTATASSSPATESSTPASTSATTETPAVAPYIDIVSGTANIDAVAEATG